MYFISARLESVSSKSNTATLSFTDSKPVVCSPFAPITKAMTANTIK